MNDARVPRYLFIFLLSLYLLTASLHIDSMDGEKLFYVAYNLLKGKGATIPVNYDELASLGPRGEGVTREQIGGGDGYGSFGPDGRYYSWSGLGWSLAALPFCALGLAIARLLPNISEIFVAQASVMLLNPVLGAACGVLVYRLGRRFYKPSHAFALALIYAIGTIAWYYAKSAFNEPLEVLLLLAALYALDQDHYLLAGLALGALLLTRQTALLLVAPIVVYVFIRTIRQGLKPIAWLLIPLGFGQLAAWGYNAYRFGNPLDYGYVGGAWDTPFLAGLYGQLISPGKGLFVFMPVLILGLMSWPAFHRKWPNWSWLFAGLAVTYLIPHTLYSYWHGGGGWGPRFLMPLIPLLLLPAGEMFRHWKTSRAIRTAVIILVEVSVLIQLLGISVHWVRHLQRVYESSANGIEYYDRILFHWADSPILGQAGSVREVISMWSDPAKRAALIGMAAPSPDTASPEDWRSQAMQALSINVLNFWFVYYGFLGAPVAVLALIAALLCALCAWSAVKLRQSPIWQEPQLQSLPR